MATTPEDLTSQIDGVTDTFTTVNDIDNGVLIDHNGQVVNVGDVTILTSTSFKLAFVPIVGDNLAAFINPQVFDITSQVDGSTNIFTKDVSDTSQGDFVAILNGQIIFQETTTIDDDTFRLTLIPQVGDTLEYFRVIEISIFVKECLEGIVKQDEIIGEVINENTIFGIIDGNEAIGLVNKENNTQGIVSQQKIKGITDCEL